MAEGRFELDNDGEGEVVAIKNYGTTFEEKEQYFLPVLLEVQDIVEEIRHRTEQGEDDDLQALLAEGQATIWGTRYDFCTEVFLVRLVGEGEGRRLAELGKGIDYEDLISRLFAGFTNHDTERVRRVINGREQLSTTEVE